MEKRSLLVLGIETSCDDTACAVLDGEGRVLASVVSSQLAAHRPYGGVVPEIASREHLANWPEVSEAALREAAIELGAVDAVAATRGPGLVGSLLVGLSLGKAIAFGLGRPFYAVHHLEGHLYSPFLTAPGEPAAEPTQRFLGLVVSGGHTSLFDIEDGRISTLAETRDDAMGEAFDKIGKRVGLPYPQGPVVDQLAERGNADEITFRVSTCSDGSLDFSYSGLKTAAILEVERLEREGLEPVEEADAAPPELLNVLASFRVAAVAQLVDRLERRYRQEPFETLAVSGGVAANLLLRRRLAEWAGERSIDLRLVPMAYAGDNAAMIAHAALLRLRRGEESDPFDIDAVSRIAI